MSGFYDRRILPRLLAAAMRTEVLVPYRERIGRAASGRVLEIGIGSALNLPFYGPNVTAVVGVDPSPALLAMARARETGFPLTVLDGAGEALPVEDGQFDTAVVTWTLCSVADPGRVLGEVRRALRPGGQLIFVEHGRSPDPGVRRWQDRLTPGWRRVAGGCHLNRPIDQLVAQAGFRMDRLDAGYARGPRPMTYMYEGGATPL